MLNKTSQTNKNISLEQKIQQAFLKIGTQNNNYLESMREKTFLNLYMR